MLEYKAQLKKLQKRLSWNSEQDAAEYKIDYCQANDTEWQTGKPKKNDIQNFTKEFEEVRKEIKPDAIRVSIFLRGRLSSEEVIKLTDVHIPLFEKEAKAEVVTAEKQNDDLYENQHEFYRNILREQKESLGSLVIQKTHEIEIQRLNDNHSNEMKFTKQEYDFKIRELQKEVDFLKERNNESTKTLEDRDAEILALEEEIRQLNDAVKHNHNEGDKAKALGATMIIGKVLDMGKEELAGLAGMLMDKDISLKETEEIKKGGLIDEKEETLTEEQKKRKVDEETIIAWIKATDNVLFSKVCAVLSTCSKNTVLFDEILKYIMGKEKTSEKPENTENTESTKTDN